MNAWLAIDERQALLALARTAVERAAAVHVRDVPHHPVFDRHAGAFVTLHVARALRGCIGIPGAERRLGEVVAHCAAAAACDDPRFPPLRAAELPALSIELSVLSPFVSFTGTEDIVIGRHGLAVELGRRRGLLLPQVALSRGWSQTMFLEHACLKAGLPAGAWRAGAVIHLFEADVFGDGEALLPEPMKL